MAHCTKCGAAVADNAGFCAACGATQSTGGQAPAVSNSTPAVPQTAMEQNVAGALCYVLGWVTGLIFYFIDKRPYVRFHAAQSIVVFGALHVLTIVCGMFFGLSMLAGGWTGFGFGFAIFHLIQLAAFVLWILLMIKAYQGEKFRLPVAADVSESIFGKS